MNVTLHKPLLLSLCIALAACQTAKHDEQPSAVPSLAFTDGAVVMEAENAQLVRDDRFWPGADQLKIRPDARGLQLFDAQGQLLSQLKGRFEGLDHRAGEHGLLVATIDQKRQQAVLLGLDRAHRWSQPLYIPKTDFAIEGLCLYRDPARNEFVFLLGEDGIGEQWLIAADERLLSAPQRVRGLSLPPESGYCQVDDQSGELLVNEEGVGVWSYAADAEAPLLRQPVDIRQPFGSITQAAAGIALVPGGLLVLDPETGALHLYRRDGGIWLSHSVLPLDALDEPEQISARLTQRGLELLLIDERGAHRARLDWQPEASAATPVIPVLPAQVQTEPVPSLGDAADDPAIWVNPNDPSNSRVLGTDKKGGLGVYDMAGKQLQYLSVGRLNNVDVRSGFSLDGKPVDLAVASNRDHNSLHLFAIDQRSGWLSDIGQIETLLGDIYGLCMFKDEQGAIHAIANDKDGRFLQYRLDGVTGEPRGELVRSFKVETQPEGCVADDRNQRLYVGEEDVAVWTLDARADAPTVLEKVIGVGGPVHDDIEGLAIYQGEKADYLVISSQGNDSYVVLDAHAPYAMRGAFRVGLNAQLGIDGASETDGLEVTSANLGGIWSRGMLVVQDGRKRMPEGPQNYKYLPWAAVAEALGLD
ncbi:phytase [Pseudomonas sp. IC_126]|uniref:phytase n=1 Tax=Pseudomonas sp. IC_126 TaxID=2547400 RepID=UPI00103D7F5E|nr:phytase [Pseudomonas sp. IC_126]TCD21382.1 phytase [Pseudomonas sp. IC_126]